MKLMVISGGLREPSSTRLLADRLGAAVRAELGQVEMEVIELAGSGDHRCDVDRVRLAGAGGGVRRDRGQ